MQGGLYPSIKDWTTAETSPKKKRGGKEKRKPAPGERDRTRIKFKRLKDSIAGKTIPPLKEGVEENIQK